MSKRAAVVGLVLATAIFAGCGSDDDSSEPSGPVSSDTKTVESNENVEYYFEAVETPYGTLECVFATRYSHDGGPSCNWEKFNQEREGR